MADIKRLLNKKSWTGQELGILELTNMAVQFRQQLCGQAPSPIVEKAQFQKMINSITDLAQGRIYNGYISIHEWLALCYNIALSNQQQAQLQFKSLSNYILEATLSENVYGYIESLPVIMTQKQYDEAVQRGREKWLKNEDGTPMSDTVLDLIQRAINFYVNQLQKDPRKTNLLKPIRKKYLQEPITSPIILSAYNEVMGEGYYTLPDGRRSDEMTCEEWQEAILPKMNEDIKSTEFTTVEAEIQDFIDRSRIIFNGGTDEEADKEQEAKKYENGLYIPTQWHYYTEPPEDITKWDIIESGDLYEFYKVALGGEDGTPEEYIAEIKDFISEFKDLISIIIRDIDTTYFKGEKGIAGLPIEEWKTTVFDWEQLYIKDFYGFKKDTDRETVTFNGNWRAQMNGVAIIKPGLFSTHNIDNNGNYKPPQIYNSFKSHSLEAFFTESENYADNVEEVEQGREALLDSYYYIKGYNLAINMISDYYRVPDLEIFKINIVGIEEKIDAINSLVPVLYMHIKNTHYEDEELKKRKLQVLKDIFSEIDYKSLTIPEANIKQVKSLFKDFKAFEEGNIADLLFYRPMTEDDEGLENG